MVRRLACDAELIPAVLGTQGQVLDVGRTSRLVTTGIWTALVLRDQHCAFPGCSRLPIACDAHHIQHWADGGTTSLDNLVLLCRKHHTLTHQTPWQVADRPSHPTPRLDPTTTHRRRRPAHLHTGPTTTTPRRVPLSRSRRISRSVCGSAPNMKTCVSNTWKPRCRYNEMALWFCSQHAQPHEPEGIAPRCLNRQVQQLSTEPASVVRLPHVELLHLESRLETALCLRSAPVQS